jgi:hypothetical protein
LTQELGVHIIPDTLNSEAAENLQGPGEGVKTTAGVNWGFNEIQKEGVVVPETLHCYRWSISDG